MKTQTGLQPRWSLLILLAWGSLLQASEPVSSRSASTPAESSSSPSSHREKPCPAPFSLTKQEIAAVDDVLDRWKQWNSHVRTFRCCFKRWTYDGVFEPSGQPEYVDLGVIRYAAPGCSLFHVEASEKNGNRVAIEWNRAEHWVFNGTSVFEFRDNRKQLIEHQLPSGFRPDREQLVDGPLAFEFGRAVFAAFFGYPILSRPFGANPSDLKSQYYLRRITPPKNDNEIWLEAYPRYPLDAGTFTKLEVIFAAHDMSPIGLKTTSGRQSIAYQFYDVHINEMTASMCQDLLQPPLPVGWQKVVERSPTAQLHATPKDVRR